VTKFKKGDKVRILRNRSADALNPRHIPLTEGLQIGDIVTIKDDPNPSIEGLPYQILHVNRGSQWMRSDDVELVEDQPMPTPEYSCIRVVPPTKPKREIVIGTHELSNKVNFKINSVQQNGSAIAIAMDRTWSFTPKSLREFADILNELASVLEENAQ